ncbi:hypothetical protein EWZ73_07005 [Helicobacter pylori]|nr:hypothetical protein [Helicobacter pylori]
MILRVQIPKLGSIFLSHNPTNIFKPPKQKSQISLVFGMNALVPLGIKTLSETNLDFLYTP